MPANLPPDYFAAEKVYKNAKTIPEKIAALEEMLAVMPHHKGTDKLRAGLTHKISRLRTQFETRTKTKRGSIFNVDRQGAAQVLLVGMPNTGKSSLLAALTNAEPDIADYPFTTSVPVIGMMPYEDIQIQLVDLPPINEELRKLPFYNLLRNADALLVVLDGSGDPGVELRLLIGELEEGKIFTPLTEEELVPISGVCKKMVIVINKCDRTDGEKAVAAVREVVGERVAVMAVSAERGMGVEDLKVGIYRVIEIVRVYTKIPGKKADRVAPFVLPAGSTIMDLARHIHHDFSENLRFARVWGSARFEGQPVQRDYILQDGDIVELHI